MAWTPESGEVVIAPQHIARRLRDLAPGLDVETVPPDPATVRGMLVALAKCRRPTVVLRDCPHGDHGEWTASDTAAAAFVRRGAVARVAEAVSWADTVSGAGAGERVRAAIAGALLWRPPSGPTRAQGEVLLPGRCWRRDRGALRALWGACGSVTLDPECGPYLYESGIGAKAVCTADLARALPRGAGLPPWCDSWPRLGLRLVLPTRDDGGAIVGLLAYPCTHEGGAPCPARVGHGLLLVERGADDQQGTGGVRRRPRRVRDYLASAGDCERTSVVLGDTGTARRGYAVND